MGVVMKRSRRNPPGVETVLYLDCGGGYTNPCDKIRQNILNVHTHKYKQVQVKLGESEHVQWILSMEYPGCDIVLQFCKMLPLEKLDKTHTGPLHIISQNYM